MKVMWMNCHDWSRMFEAHALTFVYDAPSLDVHLDRIDSKFHSRSRDHLDSSHSYLLLSMPKQKSFVVIAVSLDDHAVKRILAEAISVSIRQPMPTHANPQPS
jgi:hypothetical protein